MQKAGVSCGQCESASAHRTLRLSPVSCLVLRAVQVDQQELVFTQRRLERLTVGAEQELRAPFPVLRLESCHKRVRCNDRVLLRLGGQRSADAAEEAQASQESNAHPLNHLLLSSQATAVTHARQAAHGKV